jgi:hypothetical protein
VGVVLLQYIKSALLTYVRNSGHVIKDSLYGQGGPKSLVIEFVIICELCKFEAHFGNLKVMHLDKSDVFEEIIKVFCSTEEATFKNLKNPFTN